jgi:hypothetical protein
VCSQNAGNAISEIQILKFSWGACYQILLPNLCLRLRYTRLTPSAIAYYPGGRARRMGLLAGLPHHWKILKKCTDSFTDSLTSGYRLSASEDSEWNNSQYHCCCLYLIYRTNIDIEKREISGQYFIELKQLVLPNTSSHSIFTKQILVATHCHLAFIKE